MKHPFIRRAAALALALAFVLTLSVSLTAPARADDDPILSLTAGKDGPDASTLVLAPGDKGTLTAKWAPGKEPTPKDGGNITYTWTFGEHEGVTFYNDGKKAEKDTIVQEASPGEIAEITLEVSKEAEATAGSITTDITIRLTATWEPAEEGGQGTATATCKLTINSGNVDNPPAESKPVESKPVESQPVESQPVESQPVESKPVESDPVESKPVAVTSVSLDPTSLNLTVGSTGTLTATVRPADADDKTVTWSSSDPTVATVAASANGTKGTVTAMKAGKAVITAKAGGKEATCTVTVTVPTPTLTIVGSRSTTMDPGTLTVTATLTNAPAGAVIDWSVDREPGQTGTKLPERVAGDSRNPNPEVVTSGDGTITSTIKYTCNGAGDFIVTARYGSLTAVKSVTVSGIVLSGDNLDSETDILTMYVNGSATLTTTLYGEAADDRTSYVMWSSSDTLVVSVMPNSGSLNAWSVGRAVVTVTRGKYMAECEVNVLEDTSVIADRDLAGNSFTASTSEPLNFLDSGLYEKLKDLTKKKLQQQGAGSAPTDLNYITNLKVAPSQGTLFYNYSTDSDTGDGVGYTDQFAETARGAVLNIGRLYFVPAQGFTGTAEIAFSAVASGKNFAGVIRVEVSSGSASGEYQINYKALAGEAVWFQTSDFDTYCRSVTGRSFNYIIFNLPKSSEGALYYNYMAGSGNPVTPSLQLTQNGRYTIDNVCFVPNAAFEGKVTISFRIMDTSGTAFNGTLAVNVVTSNPKDDSSSVLISGERGRPVTFLSSLFHDACQATISDTLQFVTFELPDPTEGTLYCSYRSDGALDTRVTAATRCYFSGVPGLDSVAFVPASNAVGQVAIPYTGYGTGGASYSGTLYITLGEVNHHAIYYSVARGGSVTFSAADFNNIGRYMVGSSIHYVRFTGISSTSGQGSLSYSYTTGATASVVVPSTIRYYTNPTSSLYRGLSRVSFQAGNAMDTITITYDAYRTAIDSEPAFTGTVVIQVGSRAPEDVVLSCSTGGYAWPMSATLNSVCSAVMNGNLSYIEITGVPDAEKGRLYVNYSGVGTGTVVEPGDRFNRLGSPGIDQLTFVPRARFAGETEITYIGYSSNGQEQVSGRILINVTASRESIYFDDMEDYIWAIDSVDYLYRNRTVNGIGGGLYAPGGSVKRGDFVLMLVRAYGLTADGKASFIDVPDDAYYADAIRIAARLGIVTGYNGYFSPENALTRQDAMLMIYKILKLSGKTTTNGLVADLSRFHDAGEIDGYAREAMGNLVQMGVVKGLSGGYLAPKSQLNRAEAAMLLHTIMTM